MICVRAPNAERSPSRREASKFLSTLLDEGSRGDAPSTQALHNTSVDPNLGQKTVIERIFALVMIHLSLVVLVSRT